MLDDLPRWLPDCQRVTVLTGAGLSTTAGIPDFRGPDGVWTRDPEAERLSAIDYFVAAAANRRRVWCALNDSPMWQASPTAAHAALVAFERTGRLRALITQNVDGLHSAAGTSSDVLIELHGSDRYARCLNCGARESTPSVLSRLGREDGDPHCAECGGTLKPGSISFGEEIDDGLLSSALAAVNSSDLLIVAGSSLRVAPASWFPDRVQATGARFLVINAEPTTYDHLADQVLRSDVNESLPRVLEQIA